MKYSRVGMYVEYVNFSEMLVGISNKMNMPVHFRHPEKQSDNTVLLLFITLRFVGTFRFR